MKCNTLSSVEVTFSKWKLLFQLTNQFSSLIAKVNSILEIIGVEITLANWNMEVTSAME